MTYMLPMLPMATLPKRELEDAGLLSCGECRVCCIVYQIAEIDKPAFEPCGYLSPEPDGGCAIHDAPLLDFEDWRDSDHWDGTYSLPVGYRPKLCADYSCAWRDGEFLGLLPDIDIADLRPDRSGLLITAPYSIPETPRYLIGSATANELDLPDLTSLSHAGRMLYELLHKDVRNRGETTVRLTTGLT